METKLDTALMCTIMSHPRRDPLLGHAFHMAIHALRGVDIVRAFGRQKRGIHLLHVQPAVGQAWMAICARGARLLPVLLMARQATDAFVDSVAGPVVTRAGLARGLGSIAPGAGPDSCARAARRPKSAEEPGWRWPRAPSRAGRTAPATADRSVHAPTSAPSAPVAGAVVPRAGASGDMPGTESPPDSSSARRSSSRALACRWA